MIIWQLLVIACPHWLQAVLNLQVPVEHSKEVNDCKNLIKTLVMGTDTWKKMSSYFDYDSVREVQYVFPCFVVRNENNNMEYNTCSFASTPGLCSVVFSIQCCFVMQVY